MSGAQRRTEIVPEALAGERVDRVVAMITAESRSWVAAQIKDGSVTLNGTVLTSRSVKVATDDELGFPVAESIEIVVAPDPSIDVDVVYHDDHVLVVNKPPGLIVHPGSGNPDSTLVNGLVAAYPSIVDVGEPDRPGIVHRLDKGTSGLLVVARTSDAYDGLVTQMREHSAARRYRALVSGRLSADEGLIDAPIGRSNRDPSRMTVLPTGREARTRYSVARRFDLPVPATEVICDLDTGRTHQIRVHLRSIGHPVLGDTQYGNGTVIDGLDRPFLHAWQLRFTHPVTGEEVSATAELPDDLAGVLGQLDERDDSA